MPGQTYSYGGVSFTNYNNAGGTGFTQGSSGN